jgi:transcriptional regulator with XRE-family HTH domain
VPAAIRALRRKQAWRQEDLGRRAELSRDTVSRSERGELQGLTLGALSRLVDALGATLLVEVRWQGAELDRLIDREHALMQNAAAERLANAGWLARAEVSFNHYGDRGRCDLLAWHPSTRSLLIIEVKSRIGDVQDVLGRLDVKVRLGALLAGQVGWGPPARIIPALVLKDDHAAHRILGRHQAIFSRYGLRGRTAVSWLRTPVNATGLVWFERTDSDQAGVIGPQRVRSARPAG